MAEGSPSPNQNPGFATALLNMSGVISWLWPPQFFKISKGLAKIGCTKLKSPQFGKTTPEFEGQLRLCS